MKTSSIAKRVDLIVKECVGTQRGAKSAFAQRIGCTPGIVTHWTKGRSVPNDMLTKAIEKEFNINSRWLISGEGDMFLTLEGDRNLEIKDEEMQQITEDHPDYDISFPVAQLLQKEEILTLEFSKKARRLSRVAARKEYFLKLAFDLPQTNFKANNEITIRKTHFHNIVSGKPYLIECERGIIASKVYNLRDGRILVHLSDFEDYVPNDIKACYQMLSLSESPFDYYEPTQEEESRNNKIIRDFHNKERAGKAYILMFSLYLLLFQVTFMMMHIAASYKYDAVVAWPRLIFIHLLFIVVNGIPIYLYKTSKRAAEEFAITRWMMCFKKKFSRITNRLACD